MHPKKLQVSSIDSMSAKLENLKNERRWWFSVSTVPKSNQSWAATGPARLCSNGEPSLLVTSPCSWQTLEMHCCCSYVSHQLTGLGPGLLDYVPLLDSRRRYTRIPVRPLSSRFSRWHPAISNTTRGAKLFRERGKRSVLMALFLKITHFFSSNFQNLFN